jgi:hypothetical protein
MCGATTGEIRNWLIPTCLRARPVTVSLGRKADVPLVLDPPVQIVLHGKVVHSLGTLG